MDFALNHEQSQLKDSVRRFTEREYTEEYRRKQCEQGIGFDAHVWQTLVEQGWLGAALSEDEGGYGGAVEAMLIAHELGRALVMEPYVDGAQTAKLLSLLQQTDSLDAFIGGEQHIVLVGGPNLRIQKQTISGSVSHISAAQASHYLIVGEGALYLLPVDIEGVSRNPYRLIDGSAVAELHFDAIPLSVTTVQVEGATVKPALQNAKQFGCLMLCAQAVGAMERAIEITAEYLTIRKQFGVAIGSFQALQHRLADMHIYLEEARSMVYRALAYSSSDPQTAARAIAACKVQMARSGQFIGSEAIQLHGGIGVTQEYSIGQYFKFLTLAQQRFGSAREHLRFLDESREFFF